jgi:hypothetical protein
MHLEQKSLSLVLEKDQLSPRGIKLGALLLNLERMHLALPLIKFSVPCEIWDLARAAPNERRELFFGAI